MLQQVDAAQNIAKASLRSAHSPPAPSQAVKQTSGIPV